MARTQSAQDLRLHKRTVPTNRGPAHQHCPSMASNTCAARQDSDQPWRASIPSQLKGVSSDKVSATFLASTRRTEIHGDAAKTPDMATRFVRMVVPKIPELGENECSRKTNHSTGKSRAADPGNNPTRPA